MIDYKVLRIAAAVLFLLVPGLCCPPPPPLPNHPLELNNADKCIDKTWHFIIITKYSLFGISLGQSENDTYIEDSGVMCCPDGAIATPGSFQPRDASNCMSVDENGQPMPNAHSYTADAPPPLPFRTFAIPLLTFGPTVPTVHPQCSSQSQSGFHVVHTYGVVTRINLCTSQTIASITVTSNPLQVQVTPDGSTAVVTSYDNAISFIDTSTNTVAHVIQTDLNTFPSGLAISSDGSFALVTNYNNGNAALLKINLQTQAISSTIPLHRDFPQSVFLSPDATLAWVTYPFENVVEVLDLMTGIVDYPIPVQEPIDVVFNPTGTVAYISSRNPGSVLAVNTTTYAPISNIPTALGSSDLLLSPGGGLLTVNNFDSNSLSAIDPLALDLLSTTSVSGPPVGAAVVAVQ
jgi:DNA-binding beta-propeller fold protein YncE